MSGPFRRCPRCKGIGHDRNNCPHTDEQAQVLMRDWLTLQCLRQHTRLQRQWLDQAERNARRQLEEQEPIVPYRQPGGTLEHHGDLIESKGPTKSQLKIQEILFDNSDKIPEGLYKELMDALVIK